MHRYHYAFGWGDLPVADVHLDTGPMTAAQTAAWWGRARGLIQVGAIHPITDALRDLGDYESHFIGL